MQTLASVTIKQTQYIIQGLHDVLPEYDADPVFKLRVSRIREKLTENHSMYQFSSEELDVICMGLNDCIFVLDDILQDLDECDIQEAREFKSEIESITALLSNL
tara:strand:+ start:226 stop:537 length:312 start_codon:yes stop_codon:yes gene_type:complete